MNYLKLRSLLCLVFVVALAACQSGPEITEPEPEPVVETPEESPPEAEAETEAEVSAIDLIAETNRLSYQAALDDLKNKKVKSAIKQLEALSETAPELDYLFTNIGLAYLKIEDYMRAETAFQRAISLNIRDFVAYNHLGVIKRTQGEFKEARQAYEKAISIDENYAQAHLNLGILFDIYFQDLKLALKQYQKFQSLNASPDKTVASWIIDIERRLKSG